jgi:hypothetical protein
LICGKGRALQTAGTQNREETEERRVLVETA